MEENIPAIVTIKRIVENNNSPPLVTITLKGSTPDQDKLLYTLVNGQSKMNNAVIDNCKSSLPLEQSLKKNKKKKANNTEINSTQEKGNFNELKVTLAVDKSFRKQQTFDKMKVEDTTKTNKQNTKQKKNSFSKDSRDTNLISVENEIDMPYLRLPPGITITKVNGPLVSKQSKTGSEKISNNGTSNSNNTSSGHQIPSVSKSGVIVVDTEKLIQQSMNASNGKNRKKKKKKQQDDCNIRQNEDSNSSTKPRMVTLKNPIFHSLQTKLIEKNEIPTIPCNEQASITKGENGMVTIRRPRNLQLPIENESPMTDFLAEIKPVLNSDAVSEKRSNLINVKQKHHFNLNNNIRESCQFSTDVKECEIKNKNNKPSVLNAHDILWDLPGIEITKVNRNSNTEFKRREQTADVSIIPTSTNGEKFYFDKDDWHYGKVLYFNEIIK